MEITEENIMEFATLLHKENKEKGWWDKPRGIPCLHELIVSELSEALEGVRKNLQDDHLKQYKAFDVEMADFLIRCFDFLGASEEELQREIDEEPIDDKLILMENMMYAVSSAMVLVRQSGRKDRFILARETLKEALLAVINRGNLFEKDIISLVNEKRSYNKVRPDHIKENRDKEHGKAF